MKHSVKISILLPLAAFMFGTVLSQTYSEYDKSIDFTKYKTISAVKWSDTQTLIDEIDRTRLRDAFVKEFASRNVTVVKDNADAVVNFFMVIDEKTSTSSYNNFNSEMGIAEANWGWGMGSNDTKYSVNDYQQGTLVVSMYDADSKKLIWQGVMQGTIVNSQSKREKTIPKRVAKLMKKYPVDPEK